MVILKPNSKRANKEIIPALNIYKVGELMACKLFNKYLAGMAEMPNNTVEIRAGIMVADFVS